MDNNKFQNLINKEKYQIFLMTSPCSMPISFASHTWFVVNKKGKFSRWEVCFMKNCVPKSWNYLHQDFLPPFQGVGIIIFFNKYSWKSELLTMIEGDEGSEAHRMADFIENSPSTYPYSNTYHFIGPNSNTYTQWIINNFPDFKAKLPRNSFGKNYRISNL